MLAGEIAPPPDTASSPEVRLFGRDDELNTALRGIDQAVRRGAVVLIEGEAGIGKSVLLRAVRDAAGRKGFTTLSCQPTEVESDYPYAALADLVAPLLDELIDELPAPQRSALARALYLGPQPTGDDATGETTPGAVAAATTSLLRAAAARGPLGIVVDDLQWLDAASEQATRFAVRRTMHAGVLVVAARRSGNGDPLGLRTVGDGALVALEPRGLSAGALHAVVHDALGLSLPRRRVVELHALTAGNPLHALEIGREIVRRGGPPRPSERLPVGGSLVELLAARIAAAPASARRALDVVAVTEHPTSRLVAAMVSSDEAARQAIDQAVDVGLLRHDGDRLRPGHPLLAEVARSALPPQQRRRLHRRLADVVNGPDARTRHLAMAGDGPDETVAAALETAAVRAAATGAVDGAAELAAMAVERTAPTDHEAIERRRLLLGESLLDSGDLAGARAVADEMLSSSVSVARAGRLAILRSTTAWYLETAPAAAGFLERGLADGVSDDAVAGAMLMHLAIFCEDVTTARHHAAAAVHRLERAAADETADLPAKLAGTLATARCQLFYSEVLAGLPPREVLIEQALAIEPATGRADRSTVPAIWWAATDRVELAIERYRDLLRISRETGDLSGEGDLLTHMATAALAGDDAALADRLIDEAIAVWQQEGQEESDPALRTRALIDAYRGDLDRADEAATAALARLRGDQPDILVVAWLGAATAVAAARGDAAAVERYTADGAAELARLGVVEGLQLDLSGERVAALCQLGRTGDADELLTQLEQRQHCIPRHRLAAAITRGHALLLAAQGSLADAIAVTDVAIDAGAWPRSERARTLLVRGQLQRRARDRRGARQSLEEAHTTFEQLGMKAWLVNCGGELARLGRHRPGSSALTPTEHKVATLAASGLSTREVAARLYVSPKTVETHVGHVYAKLGISSRAELGARMRQA